jgi:alpha-glucosidase
MNYVDGSDLDPQGDYVAYSHGLYNRNAHAQEILMNAKNVTWRATGGSIDLYFYSGDTASKVISSYQNSAPGLPAMQQYWTFGYHQCRRVLRSTIIEQQY